MQDHWTGFSLEASGRALEPRIVIGRTQTGIPGTWQLAAIRKRLDSIIEATNFQLPEMTVRFDVALERILLTGRLPVDSMTFGEVLVCLRRMERLAVRLSCYVESLQRCDADDARPAEAVTQR